jgi:hypothetical protein
MCQFCHFALLAKFIRYSYDEGSLESKNLDLCEPDDLFQNSDSDPLEEPALESSFSSLGTRSFSSVINLLFQKVATCNST